MMQLTGKVKVINETQVISEKFQKREFVITDDSSQYPQDIMFQITQDRCDLIDGFSIDQVVTVNFNLRGREWTSPKGEVRYFNTIEAWKITATEGVVKTPPAVKEPQGDADNLPF
tara:strand:+ start:675 stop:1019 length:345 start_codon:yes stop_codon:yes gene_type:complete